MITNTITSILNIQPPSEIPETDKIAPIGVVTNSNNIISAARQIITPIFLSKIFLLKIESVLRIQRELAISPKHSTVKAAPQAAVVPLVTLMP